MLVLALETLEKLLAFLDDFFSFSFVIEPVFESSESGIGMLGNILLLYKVS